VSKKSKILNISALTETTHAQLNRFVFTPAYLLCPYKNNNNNPFNEPTIFTKT